MKIKILGSGGAIPTPKAFCHCKICNLARENPKYKRNSSSIYLPEIKTIIDTPEDISNSINREKLNFNDLENVFITHWHPDHSFGIRKLLESFFDFIEDRATKKINLYLAKSVYLDLKKYFNVLDYQKSLGLVEIIFFEDSDIIKINNFEIKSISYRGDDNIYGFLIKEKINNENYKQEKKMLYTPCDTISFKRDLNEFKNLDLYITECPVFSPECTTELLFDDLIKRLEILKSKKTILTHIEEDELQRFGIEHLDDIKNKYKDKNIDFEFAYDSQNIIL